MPYQDTRKPVHLSKIFQHSARTFSAPLLLMVITFMTNQTLGQECPEDASGSCYEANGTPGCDCPACCSLVCEFDPICCEESLGWDEFCAQAAWDFCDDPCKNCAPPTQDDCNDNGIPDECETDCNQNGIPDDCEEFDDCNSNNIPDECETINDCNQDGIPDECDDISDCNGNGVPDTEEGPRFCVTAGAIPVDLIVIADPSGSDDQKMPSLCTNVFEVVADRLQSDFDIQAVWTSVVDDAPKTECHDWTMPQGTLVPVCEGVDNRYIDDDDGEEWGDATAVMTTPSEDYLLGELPDWVERDAILILIPISDEGPQNGDDAGYCDCPDKASARNLIQQATLQNAQVIPIPTQGTNQCIYNIIGPVESGLMFDVAQATLGSVVDARNSSSSDLADRLEEAIRDAIAISPRIKGNESCPADFPTPNKNNHVDGGDLAYLLGYWGMEQADLNCDGITDGADLAALLGDWGPCSDNP